MIAFSLLGGVYFSFEHARNSNSFEYRAYKGRRPPFVIARSYVPGSSCTSYVLMNDMTPAVNLWLHDISHIPYQWRMYHLLITNKDKLLTESFKAAVQLDLFISILIAPTSQTFHHIYQVTRTNDIIHVPASVLLYFCSWKHSRLQKLHAGHGQCWVPTPTWLHGNPAAGRAAAGWGDALGALWCS